jgi:hypothetical protein
MSKIKFASNKHSSWKKCYAFAAIVDEIWFFLKERHLMPTGYLSSEPSSLVSIIIIEFMGISLIFDMLRGFDVWDASHSI